MGSTIDSTGYWAMSGSSISTANNGLTIAIGAPLEKVNSIEVGQVRVFDWDGLGWVQRGTDIYGSRDAENPSYQGNNFGSEVALSASFNALLILITSVLILSLESTSPPRKLNSLNDFTLSSKSL